MQPSTRHSYAKVHVEFSINSVYIGLQLSKVITFSQKLSPMDLSGNLIPGIYAYDCMLIIPKQSKQHWKYKLSKRNGTKPNTDEVD